MAEVKQLNNLPPLIPYPEGMTDLKEKKIYKKNILQGKPETLYRDERKNAPCDLIFYTTNGSTWEEEILKHYSEGKQWRKIQDGKQLKTKAGTINVYDTGIIMVQGNSETLKIFPNDFPALSERVRKSVESKRVEASEHVLKKTAELGIEERGEQRKRESEDIKEEDIKEEDIKEEDIKQEDVKQEDVKQEDIKEEDIKEEDIKQEDMKVEIKEEVEGGKGKH